jgi:cell division septum initiation protein DivIVA
MGIQQSGIYELLKHMEMLLEKSFSILPNYLVIVKVKEMEALIDRIYANLPTEIQEARGLLRRKDDFQLQAQQEAQRIVLEAQNEANKLLSESEVLRNVQKEVDKIKDQVLLECDELRKKALNDAENIRIQAVDEAKRLKDQAEIYAERTLADLEHNLTELQQVVKNGQIYMEKLRTENNLNNIYPQEEQSNQAGVNDFVIE